MNATTRKVIVSILSASVVLGSIGLLVYNGRKGKAKTETEQPPSEVRTAIPPLEFGDPPKEEEIVPPMDGEKSQYIGNEQTITVEDEEKTAEPPAPKLQELSDGELWQRLCSGDCVTAFVTFLDEVSMGAIPVKSLGEHRSDVKFTAVERDGEWFVSEESERRYQPFVDLFCSLDARQAVRVYQAMKPALQKAVDALGYKGRDIDKMVQDVLEAARAVPLYESNPPMVRLNDNMFTWKYEEIENLTPAQKSMMRMGQGNVRRIREQIEKLAAEL